MSDSSSVEDLFRRLRESIFELPLPILTDEIRKEIHLKEGFTAAALARLKLDEAIDLLNNECCLGNQDAVRELAALGLRINTILIQFIGDPTKTLDCKISDDDAASLNEPVRAEQEAKIAESIRSLRNYPPDAIRRWLVREKNSNDSIYTPAKLARFKDETSDASAADAGLPGESDLENTLTEALQHVVGQRLFLESRMAARQVAAESLVWPVSIPALSEKRDELYKGYISKLPVGTGLPFRAQSKSGGSRGRSSHQDSGTMFAIGVFQKLAIERRAFHRTIPKEKRNLLNSLKSVVAAQVEPEKAPTWMSSISDSRDGNPMRILINKWVKMARSLPELQDDNEIIKLWVDAGAALCKAECAGNWEAYRLTPCIRDRAISKPAQTLETCVKDILKSGAKASLKDLPRE